MTKYLLAESRAGELFIVTGVSCARVMEGLVCRHQFSTRGVVV